MTKQMLALLTYLAEAESDGFHRNEKESDITSPYGIYKSQHPSAGIFEKLRQLSMTLDVPKDTKEWEQKDFDLINKMIRSSVPLHQEFAELAAEFYEDYYAGANLNLLPVECVTSMASMYTTSPKNANKALQMAINSFINNDVIEGSLLIVDGAFGRISKRELSKVTESCADNPDRSYRFENAMLLMMSSRYARIAVSDPDKQLRNLNGWNNRMKKLACMKD